MLTEDLLPRPPNNSGQYRLEIKQKHAYTKKRKVKTWSPEEDEQLVRLYEEHPKRWGVIAGMMQDRNENQCLHRYRRLSQLGAHKKIWSAQEDQTILSLIKKVGKNWKLLAEIIGTKTGKQIRERFINKLDPKIKNDDWTDQQDRLILRYYSQVGSKWSQISKKIPGRPQNKIKNRFYSFIQKNYDISYVRIDGNQGNGNMGDGKMDLEGQFDGGATSGDKFWSAKGEVKEIEMTELKENMNINQEAPTKRKRRNRIKLGYTRFSSQDNQQNIYQDQPQPQSTPQSKPHRRSHPTIKKQPQQLPSIKQLQDEFKISGPEPPQPLSRLQLPQIYYLQNSMYMGQGQQKDQIFDSNVQIGQKFYIKSLIRVEEEFGAVENRYRSIRDLVSNNQIEHQENQLLYLSHH